MYTIADEQLLPLSRSRKVASAAAVESQRFDPAFDQVSQALTELTEVETQQATASAAHAEQTYKNARTMMAGIQLFALVAVAIGVAAARSVSKPLGHVVTVLRRVKGGDLTAVAGLSFPRRDWTTGRRAECDHEPATGDHRRADGADGGQPGRCRRATVGDPRHPRGERRDAGDRRGR
ncbi:hypothetical protein [Actinoplanes sp. NPDC026670]|uniref:hypothetical protein n=1 Tax=Actinoplanes sp. NPDC026670 TaxID=3154700 RepID=UPI0033D60EA5